MCRNIKTLFNFDPPATQEEIQAACRQFVRKVSGATKPSLANAAAFDNAVADITATVSDLLVCLVTTANPKNRETEAAKAKLRAAKRFATARAN